MMKNVKANIWGDNWIVENDTAWMVSAPYDLLFKINVSSHEYELVRKIPNDVTNLWRLNSRIIKCNNDIYCMPDFSSCIWVYNIEQDKFQKIEIDNPNNIRLSISWFWIIGDCIFAISIGLKKVIVIDSKKKKIINYYGLSDDLKESISKSILVDECIYCVSETNNQIYQFNIETKNIKVYKLPNIKGNLNRICYDGVKFWLIGNSKEIYIWNKGNGSVEIVNDLPDDFGSYRCNDLGEFYIDTERQFSDVPIFFDLIYMENHIWCIPWQTNKILYIDKNTYEVRCLEIADEEETKESFFGRACRAKYSVEYLRNERYIGLFSFKNECILEIDTVNMKVERINYHFSKNCMVDFGKLYGGKDKIYGENYKDKLVYEGIILNDKALETKKKLRNIGLNIYNQINI
jgi:hypothetical protein